MVALSPASAQQVILTGTNNPGDPATIDSSTVLWIGLYGDGELNIQNGGVLNDLSAYIGGSAGDEGIATVTGLGSEWHNGNNLDIGFHGVGTLNIAAGGVVSARNSDVGYTDEGHVLVSGTGSRWSNSGRINIGNSGTGNIVIEDGATVSSNAATIGVAATGRGEVLLTSGGSWTLGGLFTVGGAGHGVLEIEDGAVVSAGGVDLGTAGASANGTLVLRGTLGARGVLETNRIRGGLGTADLTIDGGVLRATDDAAQFFQNYGSQTVSLGAAGGTIDTNGYDIGISPELTGAGGLTKQGAGTLTLTGANSFVGGTTIDAGTLQLGGGGTSGSILGNVTNSGVLAFNRSDQVTFGGTITGTGGVQQLGAGRTTLTADNSGLLGVSAVHDGILSINGILGGTLEVVGGRLQGNGQVGSTTNFSGGTIAPGNSIGTLTINGNYVGNGGTLEIETVLGDDSSATDLLIVTGDTSGNTNVRVINVGGVGAQTIEGIKIVEVGGASNGSFALLGDYLLDGEQTVVAGAYGYRLYQNGVSTPADGNWYLRSTAVSPGASAGLLYQAGAPVYEAYAAVLQDFEGLDTLQQRLGDRVWNGGETNTEASPTGTRRGLWSRVAGSHTRVVPSQSTTGADYSVDTWQLQIGADRQLYTGSAGDVIGSLALRYGTISSDVASVHGHGSIGSVGQGLDGSLTWYGTEGFYLDAAARMTWYDSTLSSSTAQTRLVSGNNGFGYAMGLEAGRQIVLDQNWSATPQAQLTYSGVSFDRFSDVYGAKVALADGQDLKLRLGLSADYRDNWIDAGGERSHLHVYGIANLYIDALPQSQVLIENVRLSSARESLWGGLGLGGTYSWGDGKYAIYGQAGINTGLVYFGRSYSIAGTTGLAVKF
ncbi:autotransporter outer membrane beta-barrel domain-containing protein [Devosia sp.]|uniref:autotransporter family protein n=1 Tax=Devosia sp. TaxID=1871048 RepID=UPI0025F390FD|nr:autotransporter outer membrane beta-barrel domain-containing protein [Devosia sp.]MCR6636526.1 autotransporter outer membrane beta-barrel domain-containing protein [Devosia sp.]